VTERPLRVMWLLNHTTARSFEIPMLKRIGVQEIFLPKKTPADPTFRSTSIDWSEDANLSIPPEDLAILNATNWYDDPGTAAWEIANRHFDVLFFILLKSDFFRSMTRHFRGAKIWRAFGLPKISYHGLLTWLTVREGPIWSAAARNLWIGKGFDHLSDVEPDYIAKNSILLPPGLPDTEVRDNWIGKDKRVFFVCPDLAYNEYYQEIYRDFKKTFDGLPYAVAGAQPIAIHDDHVLGYVSKDQHDRHMREMRVMYYHSTEPNHVHYHPFEAVRAGMPLVFMAGGLLDRIGGLDLPGRCRNPEEARKKIKLILNGDRGLIEDIRRSQPRLLAPLKAEHSEPVWRTSFQTILRKLEESVAVNLGRVEKKRIAVILPREYRRDSLRGAKLLARAISVGSRADGNDIEVVFAHLGNPEDLPEETFEDLPDSISRRPYFWRKVSHAEAIRASSYAGLEQQSEAQAATWSDREYIYPDDGINQFTDCDLWIVLSDHLDYPLLPLRPYLLMVDDYRQRYQTLFDDRTNQQYVRAAHAAEAVLVTTEFTARDARQFAGIPATRIKKLPMLAPELPVKKSTPSRSNLPNYFIWTTNLAPQNNHENAFNALRLYYDKYAGALECRVTGLNIKDMMKRDVPAVGTLRELRRSSRALRQNLKFERELSDRNFQMLLQGAGFLWHPGRIDNGTFSVIDAARLDVPSLSSDYPAMREIDGQFRLNLAWTDPHEPDDMARELKHMEVNLETARNNLPSADALAGQSVDRLAGAYWGVIREYL
jgi:glycosyltransferase involved in cell wall biosynthesis